MALKLNLTALGEEVTLQNDNLRSIEGLKIAIQIRQLMV